MKYIPLHVALVLCMVTAPSLTIRAQELKDRQLVPAYDFGTIQMPVEIVSIKLNGKELRPGENITGNDDWLRGVSFTLKNIGDQPIAYVNIGFEFRMANGLLVYVLPYGVDLSRGIRRIASSQPAIQPGQTVNLELTNYRYQSFLHVLAQARAANNGASINLETASYYIERVSFENQPDMLWQGGFLKKRNSAEFDKFDLIGRYVRTRQN